MSGQGENYTQSGPAMTYDKIATDLVNRFPNDERARLRNAIAAALREAYERGVEEAAKKCCTIDSSDSSHETAEANAAAIRALKTS